MVDELLSSPSNACSAGPLSTSSAPSTSASSRSDLESLSLAAILLDSNGHGPVHRSSCFKKKNECRYKAPWAPFVASDITVRRNDQADRIVGLEVNLQRDPASTWVTQTCTVLTDVFLCNSNVRQVDNSRLPFYLAAYQTKNRKDDASSLTDALNQISKYMAKQAELNSTSTSSTSCSDTSTNAPVDSASSSSRSASDIPTSTSALFSSSSASCFSVPLAAPSMTSQAQVAATSSLATSSVSDHGSSSASHATAQPPRSRQSRGLGLLHSAVYGHTRSDVVAAPLAGLLLLKGALHEFSACFTPLPVSQGVAHLRGESVYARMYSGNRFSTALDDYLQRPLQLAHLSWYEFAVSHMVVVKRKEGLSLAVCRLPSCVFTPLSSTLQLKRLRT